MLGVIGSSPVLPTIFCVRSIAAFMSLPRWLTVLLVYIGILSIAACVAPMFYLLVHTIEGVWSIECLRYLANKPLECYVDRLRVIIGCIVVFVAVHKSPKIYSWNLRHGFLTYVKTFIFGVFTWITLFFAIRSFVSTVEIKTTPTASLLLQAFIAGLSLAIAEEVIFRGFLWDFVRNGRRTFDGLIPLSIVFALLHFSHCNAGNASNLLIQGFQCAFRSLTDIPQRFSLEFFLCVFLLSLLLGMFRLRTQTLWSSIGFHQGLIMMLFVLRKYIRYPEASTSHFWGTGRLTDAWFVVLILCLLCMFMFVRTKKQSSFPTKI